MKVLQDGNESETFIGNGNCLPSGNLSACLLIYNNNLSFIIPHSIQHLKEILNNGERKLTTFRTLQIRSKNSEGHNTEPWGTPALCKL